MSLPEALFATASRQRSLFSLAQARMERVSQDRLDRLVRTGSLERPLRAVFALPGVEWTWERRLVAACLAGGPGTAVSHRAAALVWELSEQADPVVEVTIPRSRSPRFVAERSIIAHRPLQLPPRHVTVRRRIPVTNPLRTMIDFAGVASDAEIEDALDAGVAQKLFTVRAVARMRSRLAKPGRPGPGRLKPFLEAELLGGHARSVLESRMARLWRRFGLPPFVFQYVVRTADGRFVARPDFSIVDVRIAVEVDGWRDHGSPRATARDHRRRNALLAAGWLVITFTWEQVRDDPARVAADIRAAVSARLTV